MVVQQGNVSDRVQIDSIGTGTSDIDTRGKSRNNSILLGLGICYFPELVKGFLLHNALSHVNLLAVVTPQKTKDKTIKYWRSGSLSNLLMSPLKSEIKYIIILKLIITK